MENFTFALYSRRASDMRPAGAKPLECTDGTIKARTSAEISECWARKFESAQADMHKSYDRAVSAAKTDFEGPGDSADLRPSIAESQVLWEQWSKRECTLE